jgi:dTDP-4-dehydrorhamnose 3,5-epimerase-like enzyme
MIFSIGSIDGVVVRPLERYADARGWLIELYRADAREAGLDPVMAYVSQTLPGVVRGPHEHREQSDCFALVGPGDFKLYLWDNRPGCPTLGHKQVLVAGESNPTRIIVPPGVVHAYQNVSRVPGLVFNCPDRLYAGPGKRSPVDEIRHENDSDTPFALD